MFGISVLVRDLSNPGVGKYFFHGATRETENIVEGRAKRFNSFLHTIKCSSL